MGDESKNLDLDSNKLRDLWLEGANKRDCGFYVAATRDCPNEVDMPKWTLIREADGPEGLAVYQGEYGDLFAVGCKDGLYAVRIRT